MSVERTALTDADVSVFVLSGYTTDRVLVETDDLGTAAERLRDLGCPMEEPSE